ncbi:MAG: CCA tRNA nucleotidyltransferase, partial [Acidimicrobiia bacterium]|nr:CCA tRNA nucleotidyltransferase [Acidimicrobiia bacterium]
MGAPISIDFEALDALAPVINPVAKRFVAAGHHLYLVGGIVRDLSLGRLSGFDIDFTTDAHPKAIKTLLGPLAEHVWTQGERFGTIGAQIDGHALEITTHRAERYDPESRKPIVTFGDQLDEDLSRRDFTINAMAIEVPDRTLHDPFGGAADLEAKVLRTPLSPEVSFGDDPLRMLRAARFIARFELSVDEKVAGAATELAGRLDIVSVERVNDEIERLLATDDPSAGFDFIARTGLLAHAVAPMSADEVIVVRELATAPGNALVRRAGLLWPTDVAAVVRRLRYSNQDRAETTALVRGVRDWVDHDRSSPAAARLLIAKTGADAPRSLACNVGAATSIDSRRRLAAGRLVEVIDELVAAGDVGPYDSPLSGSDIMELLDIEPGPVV